MNLVWKLLRQHISVPQFAGFILANLFGMLIVLFGYQFYNDILPVFTQQDSFMKADYIIVSKRIGTANTISGSSNSFTTNETADIKSQPFTQKLGQFTSTEYKAEATMGIQGQTILNTEMYFESVPDDFIDIPLTQWQYTKGSKTVPVILPRSYINMYNFGFAQSHSLPKISDGLVGIIDFQIFIHTDNATHQYKGNVIGFSNRLSSILVPQTFMDWTNSEYAPGRKSQPTRLLLQLSNPADDNVTQYMDQHAYDIENDRLDAEKTTYFLRMLVSIVMAIGIIISALSFYILMLSIYLLVQKNSDKLHNLLLIGYSPATVARPYQLLTAILNSIVLLLALILLFFIRAYYMDFIYNLFPDTSETSFLPAILLGIAILSIVTFLNFIVINRKISLIWKS